jgi:hypothetical protein
MKTITKQLKSTCPENYGEVLQEISHEVPDDYDESTRECNSSSPIANKNMNVRWITTMNKQFSTICSECGYDLRFNGEDIESPENRVFIYATRCTSCGKYTEVTLYDLCNEVTMSEQENGVYDINHQSMIGLHNLLIDVIAGKINNEDLIKKLKVVYRELKEHFDGCDYDDSWYDDRIDFSL